MRLGDRVHLEANQEHHPMKKTLSAVVAMAASIGILGIPGFNGSARRNFWPLSRHCKNPKDPKDPRQAARIKAAQMKRSHKEKRRCLTTAKSLRNNPTILHALPLRPLSPMDQMDQEIAGKLKEIKRKERAVMRQVRGLVRRRVYADIVKYMHEDSDWVGDLRIDESHGGEEVDLNEYAFKRAYIYQTVNGGYTGDDYAGHIWIPLNAGKYLHFHYSC